MATSKLFVPLAEEYLKNGMLDEAMQVLQEGLALHPNYLGARVSLGKVYLQKGLVPQAVGEFEKVVQVSPDNIYSHKQLAKLYLDMGRIQDAISACETVLVFAPKDTEATTLLTELLTLSRLSPGGEAEAISAASDLSLPAEEKIDFNSHWEADTGPETEAPTAEEVFETETLADLYVAQGENARGIAVYRKLLDRDPQNELLRKKLIQAQQGSLPRDSRTIQIQRLESWLGKIQSRIMNP